MKILYLHQFSMNSGWGGSASMLCSLHRALIGLSYQVDVVSARRPDPYGLTTCALPFESVLTFGPEKRPGETTIDELSASAIENMALAAAEKIEREAFRYGLPDLVVANHINLMALVCWRFNKNLGIPYRIISYGTDTKLLLQDQRYRHLFGDAARDADCIFAISEYVAREVAMTVGGKIEVLGGAVDPALFFRSRTSATDCNTLIFFGRLVTEKGIWILLDSIARQTTANELLLVGEGPLRKEIENVLARTSLNCRVKCLGYRPQAKLRELLINAKAAVVPSIWQEPLGLVVLEAFACGLPVIASAVGGIPEMVRHNENGLLVRESDAVDLANAIDRLLSDVALYRRLRHGVMNTTIPAYRDLALRLTRDLVNGVR